jgi:hypothetical protein
MNFRRKWSFKRLKIFKFIFKSISWWLISGHICLILKLLNIWVICRQFLAISIIWFNCWELITIFKCTLVSKVGRTLFINWFLLRFLNFFYICFFENTFIIVNLSLEILFKRIHAILDVHFSNDRWTVMRDLSRDWLVLISICMMLRILILLNDSLRFWNLCLNLMSKWCSFLRIISNHFWHFIAFSDISDRLSLILWRNDVLWWLINWLFDLTFNLITMNTHYRFIAFLTSHCFC